VCGAKPAFTVLFVFASKSKKRRFQSVGENNHENSNNRVNMGVDTVFGLA
jgi:hypothetical protein